MPRYTLTYAPASRSHMTAPPTVDTFHEQASSLLADADAAIARGDYARAVELAGGALSLAADGRMSVLEAHALGALTAAEARLGDGERAIHHGHCAIVLLQRSGDAGRRSQVLCNLVVAYLCVGLPADALACATAALEAARAVGDPSLVSWALNRSGSTHRALGEAQRGVQLIEEALRLAREHALAEEQSSACNNLCGALLPIAAAQAGDERARTLERAIEIGEQGLALAQGLDNAYGATMCHGVLAGAYLAAGHLDTAFAHATRSRTLAQRHGYRLAALTARIISATLERERGHVEASIALYEALLAEMRGTDDCDWVVAVHQGLHESYKRRPDPARALEHLEALRHFDRQLQEQRARRQVRVMLGKIDIEQASVDGDIPTGASVESGPSGSEFAIDGLDDLVRRAGPAAAAAQVDALQDWLASRARTTDRVIRVAAATLLVIHPETSLVAAEVAFARLQALARDADADGLGLRAVACRFVVAADVVADAAEPAPSNHA